LRQLALANTVEKVESLQDLLNIVEGAAAFGLFAAREFNSER
jgi:hypothetical protein